MAGAKDGYLYRGKIVETRLPDYKVLFIDYGNTEIIANENMFQANENNGCPISYITISLLLFIYNVLFFIVFTSYTRNSLTTLFYQDSLNYSILPGFT